MATGRGSSLGAALVDLLQQGALGGPRSTYDRVGWRAQFSQLAGTKAGYAAMEAAGLSASIRTQRGWLSGDVTASRENRDRIGEAYKAMAGGWNPRWETASYKISGRVTQGRDSRERGKHGTAPLVIDGNVGEWDPVREAWEDGADEDRVEGTFIGFVVVNDLGEGSHPWQFDGDWYEVSA